jgi:putative membrane protein
MLRTADGLTVRRGLLTRHEIHVRRSRIQTITLQQDWIDRCLGRRNVVLEPISHLQPGNEDRGIQQKRIVVPSVRRHEVDLITREVLPSCPIDTLAFTPVSVRHLYLHGAVVTGLCLLALAWFRLVTLSAAEALPEPTSWLPLAVPVVWLALIVRVYLGWRRGGLAVHGDIIVARSGAIGTEYRIFQAHKIQDVTHIQSPIMRRQGLSSLRFHTASTTIRVPYMPTAFMRKVVDYCLFQVESGRRSWM